MKKLLIALTASMLFFNAGTAQQNYDLGLSLGLGKSFFHNEFPTDNNHYSFVNPTSIAVGTQLVKNLNANNQLVFKLGYSSKRIKFEYNLNEITIPLKVNDAIIDKYNCFSLSAGYRRPFQINNINFFAEIGLTTDYNVNVAQSSKGSSNDNFTVPFNGPVTYHFTGIDNLGNKSITIGSTVSLGCKFGMRKRSELSFNINIPFNDIQKNPSNHHYVWEYQGTEYVHNLNYKGSVIYPSINYTMYVFTK
jgi:hypothetical protein